MNDTPQNQPGQENSADSSSSNSQSNYYPTQTPTTSSDDLFPPNSPGSTVRAMIGGRLITTALGMVLMVAGLAAGVALVMQPQLLEELAYELPPTPTIQVVSSSTFGKSIKNCDQKCASYTDNKVIGSCESIGLNGAADDRMFNGALNNACFTFSGGLCDHIFRNISISCNGSTKETSNCRCKLTPR